MLIPFSPFALQVSNPISVKTKVHSSKSTNGIMDEWKRETSYLEVQVQNTSDVAITFESTAFEPAEGLGFQDVGQNLYTGPSAFLQPGAVRQYLFIVFPLRVPSSIVPHAQKAGVLTLGRLDLAWRSALGERGRLQTSPLTRKFTPNAAPRTGSTVPRRTGTGSSSPHSNYSPTTTLVVQRSSASISQQQSSRLSPQSVSPSRQQPAPALPGPLQEAPADIQFDLSVTSRPYPHALVEQPFTVGCRVRVANQSNRPRRLRLGVQHVQYHSDRSVEAELATALSSPFSRQLLQPSQAVSMTRSASVPSSLARKTGANVGVSVDGSPPASPPSKPRNTLPPPIPLANPYAFLVRERGKALPSENVVHLGGSLQDLGDIELAEGEEEASIATCDFNVSYMALEKGVIRLGGLRLLIMSEEASGHAAVVKEVDVVAEVWVAGSKVV
jgi:trafficking protein particle complex subunit 13